MDDNQSKDTTKVSEAMSFIGLLKNIGWRVLTRSETSQGQLLHHGATQHGSPAHKSWKVERTTEFVDNSTD